MPSGLQVENSVDQLRVAVYHAALRAKRVSAAGEVDPMPCSRRLSLILQGEGYGVEVEGNPAGAITRLLINGQLVVQVVPAGEPGARAKEALVDYLHAHHDDVGLLLDFRKNLLLDGLTVVPGHFVSHVSTLEESP